MTMWAADRVDERRGLNKMATIPFKWYVYDECEEDEIIEGAVQRTDPNFVLTEDMAENAYRQLSKLEVVLNCEIDSDTGEVTILGLDTVQ